MPAGIPSRSMTYWLLVEPFSNVTLTSRRPSTLASRPWNIAFTSLADSKATSQKISLPATGNPTTWQLPPPPTLHYTTCPTCNLKNKMLAQESHLPIMARINPALGPTPLRWPNQEGPRKKLTWYAMLHSDIMAASGYPSPNLSGQDAVLNRGHHFGVWKT